MMFLARHAARLTLRDLRRTGAIGLGISLAAALMTSVLLFGTASGSTVTRRALETLPVDAQVILEPTAEQTSVLQTVTSDPAVKTALPFELVSFDTAKLDKAGTATQTSTGALVAVDQNYVQTTGLFKPVEGSQTAGQITISRDLATNLGAVPGDSVTFTLPGGGTAALTVSGIVDTVGADLILGPVDAAHRTSGANPLTNVAVTDRATLDGLAANIPPGAVKTPPNTGQSGSASPVTVPEPAVRREIHLKYDHAQLPGDPVAAQTWLDTVRHRIEIQGAGSFTVVDDAAA